MDHSCGPVTLNEDIQIQINIDSGKGLLPDSSKSFIWTEDHSRPNAWLQWIGERHLHGETRNISVLVFGGLYTTGFTVCSREWRCSWSSADKWWSNRMAWQWAETLVEIRVTLADIRGTTKYGCRHNFPKHEFNRPVCLEAHHFLLAHLSD